MSYLIKKSLDEAETIHAALRDLQTALNAMKEAAQKNDWVYLKDNLNAALFAVVKISYNFYGMNTPYMKALKNAGVMLAKAIAQDKKAAA